MSFTEYLNMMANLKNGEPTPESILDAFEIFDKVKNTNCYTYEYFIRCLTRIINAHVR